MACLQVGLPQYAGIYLRKVLLEKVNITNLQKKLKEFSWIHSKDN